MWIPLPEHDRRAFAAHRDGLRGYRRSAEIELGNQLNPNLPFTLADHVQFAVERLKSGVDLTMPIAYDIRHLYPKETEMADAALQILHDKAGLDLPANEAVNIAMHFINAEAESGDIHSLMLSMQIIPTSTRSWKRACTSTG